MGEIKTYIFCIFCVLSVVCFESSVAAPTTELEKLTTEQLKGIVAGIPEIGRHPFIKKNIQLGYELEIEKKRAPSQDYEYLAVQIFNYFIDNKEAIRQRIETMSTNNLMETICFPEPIGCIDSDDPGIRP